MKCKNTTSSGKTLGRCGTSGLNMRADSCCS